MLPPLKSVIGGTAKVASTLSNFGSQSVKGLYNKTTSSINNYKTKKHFRNDKQPDNPPGNGDSGIDFTNEGGE
jgi:hypothetical protein